MSPIVFDFSSANTGGHAVIDCSRNIEKDTSTIASGDASLTSSTLGSYRGSFEPKEEDYRVFSIHRQVYDLSSYYEHKQGPAKRIRFNKVAIWEDFEALVSKNTKDVSLPDASNLCVFPEEKGREGIDDLLGTLLHKASSVLEKTTSPCKFVTDMKSHVIGECDKVLSLEGKNTPQIIGLHREATMAPALNNTVFFTKLLSKADNVNTEMSCGEKGSVSVVQELFSLMMVNGCRYGYISTGSNTRFVKITSVFEHKKGDGPLKIEIAVTQSIAWDKKRPFTLLAAIVAVAVQSRKEADDKGSTDKICMDVEFCLSIQTLAEPDMWSLSKHESPCLGKKKWWKYKKDNDMVASVRFNRSELATSLTSGSLRDAEGGINFGTLCLSFNPASLSYELKQNDAEFSFIKSPGAHDIPFNDRPSVLKCASYLGDNLERLHRLENEAKVYEYLEKRGLHTVAKRYVFGDILGIVKVLALEPVGRAVRPSDLNKSITEQMRTCVSSLHENNLLHGDIRLSNFLVDDLGKVRIVNFGKTKLYARLHPIVVQDEINMVKAMIAPHMSDL